MQNRGAHLGNIQLAAKEWLHARQSLKVEAPNRLFLLVNGSRLGAQLQVMAATDWASQRTKSKKRMPKEMRLKNADQ